MTIELDERTPVQHLQNIRNILALPVADLASLFEVSRQSIYKWLAQDSFPEMDKIARITELSKVAVLFKNSGIHRAGILLNMKLFSGQSLFWLFKARKPYENELRELIAEAQVMEKAYEECGIAQSNTKPTNDWLSSISIPASKMDYI